MSIFKIVILGLLSCALLTIFSFGCIWEKLGYIVKNIKNVSPKKKRLYKKTLLAIFCIYFFGLCAVFSIEAATVKTINEFNTAIISIETTEPTEINKTTEPEIKTTKIIETTVPTTTKKIEEEKIKTTTEKIQNTKSYTDEELYVLSHVIYGEASGRSNEMQLGVGSVVLNRVKDSRFPNTIKGVVFQKNQYACTWDGNYNKTPDQQAINNAIYLLENGSQLPNYVIFQAEFIQGKIYKHIGNTYFCY